MTDQSRQTNGAAGFPLIRDVGLSGVLISFSDRLTDAANRAALAFRQAVEAEAMPGIVETSTALTSAFVSYDPVAVSRDALRDRLAAMLERQDWAAAALPAGRHLWRIPAVFGGPEGPQLAQAAQLAGLSVDDAVAEITHQRVRVMAIGFAPGQPYLGTLPAHWDIPRQAGLTAQVPAGAIVVAIRQLNIFTNDTPTGWRHIGQTAFRNFRRDSAEPFALNPGDEVCFERIGADQLAELRRSDRTGDGGATREAIP